MPPRKWDINQLPEAVSKSRSIRQVLGYLGLRQAGGNYSLIKRYIDLNKINTAHFLGKGWNVTAKNLRHEKAAIESLLVANSTYQSFKLKRRLIQEGFFAQQCSECGWQKRAADGRIPLELHHINGIRNDNRLENLQILCPNCHSLKSNHRGRNIKK